MKITLLFILLILSLACTRHEEPTVEDRFQKIQGQIDRKNYQAAEEELQSILEAEPANEKARVILASVYVHKAGITVKDYFLLEKLTHFESDEDRAKRPPLVDLEALQKLKIKADSDFGKAMEFLKQVNEAAARGQEIIEKFNQIPALSEEGAENVYRALLEMERIENPETGNALYRGVIKLLYFKYLWSNERFFSFGEGKFCSQSPLKFSQRLDLFQVFTSGLIRDLGNGFPKSKTGFDRTAEDLTKNSLEAQKWLGLFKTNKQSLREIVNSVARSQSVTGFSCDF